MTMGLFERGDLVPYEQRELKDDIAKTKDLMGRQLDLERESRRDAERRADESASEAREQTEHLQRMADNFSVMADQNYEQYLEQREYSSRLEDGITGIIERVGQGFDQLSNAIEDGAEQISNHIDLMNLAVNLNLARTREVISDQLDVVHHDLIAVADGIESLGADFNIGLGKVLMQFEMNRQEQRQNVIEIGQILRNKRKTDAEEHFQDAKKLYEEGCKHPEHAQWFLDSLSHFLQAAEQYPQNPFTHLYLGHLYHYQAACRDFAKAIVHYHRCYVYAEADEKLKAIAAQGCFYAGWLSAVAAKNPDLAITYTRKALAFDPKLGEAHYHLAKFHAVKGEAKQSMQELEIAIIRFDRDYLIKASADQDFADLEKDIYRLYLNLKASAQKRYNLQYAELLPDLNGCKHFYTGLDQYLAKRRSQPEQYGPVPFANIVEQATLRIKSDAKRYDTYRRFEDELRQINLEINNRDSYYYYLDGRESLLRFKERLNRHLAADNAWLQGNFAILYETWRSGAAKKHQERQEEERRHAANQKKIKDAEIARQKAIEESRKKAEREREKAEKAALAEEERKRKALEKQQREESEARAKVESEARAKANYEKKQKERAEIKAARRRRNRRLFWRTVIITGAIGLAFSYLMRSC